VHERVFAWVLERLAERGLVMEANVAMRSIRRRDTDESYRTMLTRMAEASEVATPSAAELKQCLHRTHLRGRENVQKRYFVHVAGYNLGLVVRQLIGAGTPKELPARSAGLLWLLDPDLGLLMVLILPPEPGPDPTSSTGC
jgi:transposase